MAGTFQPLDQKFAIVDKNGNPTDYFTRWAQKRQLDIGTSITLADLADYLAAHKLIPGTGIQLTPDGNIADGVTIHADAQAILDEITATRGAVIYRGLLGWSALLPGTAGYVLSTNGTGADPTWVAQSGGGSSAPWWFNPPLASSFTLASGDSNSLSLTNDTNAGLIIDCPNPVAGDIQRIAYRTLTTPSGDFDFKVRVEGYLPAAQYGQLMPIGVMDGVGGRIQALTLGWDGTMNIINWSGLVGYSSTPFTTTPRFNTPNWFRVQKVGTTLNYYVSTNGKTWVLTYSTTATAWLANAPNRLFVGNNYNHTSISAHQITVEYFSLTGTAV